MQFVIDMGLALLYFVIFLLLCAWSWRFWMMYINQKHLNSIDWLMLEVKLPREISKSPYAAELAISSLLQSGGLGHKYGKYFKGNMPVYSSLEIASMEGVIHFYIRIQRKFRSLVESSFYAQYPGIELVEVDDYTKAIRYHHLTNDVSCWAESYNLSKKWNPTNPKTGKAFSKKGGDSDEPKDDDDKYSMPADFFPIKTYVDYGLDKDPKEEFKVDPLAQLIEVMGSIGKNEYYWYQILLQDESVYNNKKWPKLYMNEKTHEHLSLSDMAKYFKAQVRTSAYLKKGDTVDDGYGGVKQVQTGKDADGNPVYEDVVYKYKDPKAVGKDETKLTQEEKDQLEAINKKLSKTLAVGIVRIVYVTKKANFNGNHIQSVLSFPKPFVGMNSLGLKKLSDPYDFPWQNFMNRRTPWRTEEMFEEYVEREGFFPHISQRDTLDKWEDTFFWATSMKSRKVFRMIYESIFYPFEHPHPEEASTYNLEEIATLWHLPGSTVGTPTLPRIDSNKGVAPVNLPL